MKMEDLWGTAKCPNCGSKNVPWSYNFIRIDGLRPYMTKEMMDDFKKAVGQPRKKFLGIF
jgi:hypothetical protein